MKPIHRSQVTLFLEVCGMLAWVAMVTPARAQETSVASLNARLEGAYVLESWKHANGEVLRPPAVDARAVLVSGRVMFIAHDRGPDPNSQTTVAGFGTYTLEPGKYSYGYERYTVVSQTPGGTFVSETLPWEGNAHLRGEHREQRAAPARGRRAAGAAYHRRSPHLLRRRADADVSARNRQITTPRPGASRVEAAVTACP